MELSSSTTLEPVLEAIHLAESMQTQQAFKCLRTCLQSDNQNATAWLWYSRLLTNLVEIEKALKYAYHLAPSDNDIRQEAKRFLFAKEHITASQIKRCPICWAPLNIDAQRCVLCGAAMAIDRQLMNHQSPPMRIALRQAQRRYNRVAGTAGNPKVFYCLSLIHFNFLELDRSAEFLAQAISLAPDEAYYVKQREALAACREAEPATGQAAQPDASNPTDIAPSAPPEPKTILVVEDSKTVRKMVSRTLQHMDHCRIAEAINGDEALTFLSAHTPDLVFLDIILPGISGYEILEKIKSTAATQDVPVVVLSLKDLEKEKARLSMADDFMPKPFSAQQLLAMVNKFIST